MHINASLIITTNRKIETWAEIFFDPVMANAALDRIVNNSYRVVLEGDFYRKNFTPKLSLSYSLCKLQKDIVEDTIKKQLKYRGKNG